jgi:hypothetical protein
MKKLIAATSFLFLCVFTNAQAPQGLNYQAVARTADGVIIPTQNIGVRFSILDVSITGAVLYSETHTVTTNSYGLFTLTIGKGTPVTSTFPGINWASGTDKFLKVEIAAAGGSNYQLQGTTQLLSVPYALYSEKTRLIAGNNTINITNGNTITGNYQAGTGIGISGNVITNTATNQWLPHANGIYYNAGHVGIGTTPHSLVGLTIQSVNTNNLGNATLHLRTNDTWHNGIGIFNNTNQQYSLLLTGSSNTDAPPGTFGIFNHIGIGWSMSVNPTTNNVGIGSLGFTSNIPKSKLHVFNGDVNIEQIGSGIIMKSPNGQCWRVTIDNAGNLVRTAITCL